MDIVKNLCGNLSISSKHPVKMHYAKKIKHPTIKKNFSGILYDSCYQWKLLLLKKTLDTFDVIALKQVNWRACN